MSMRISILALSIALSGIGTAFGQTTPAASEATPPESAKERTYEALPRYLAARVDAYQADVIGSVGNTKVAQQVIDVERLWRPGEFPLKVCFFSSRSDVILKIVRYAREWESEANGVRFDFGVFPNLNRCTDPTTTYQIRIGFEPTGYWSLIGRDSVEIAQPSEQSMNFGRWGSPDVVVSEGEMRSIVLHEFGHALGLHHAHQNPESSCEDDFDFPRIYARLRRGPNFWEEDKVDYNLRAIRTAGILATPFDPLSIMKYYFPPEFYRNGVNSTCYSDENERLSDGDLDAVAALYPADQIRAASAANARVSSIIGSLDTVGESSGGRAAAIARLFNTEPRSFALPAAADWGSRLNRPLLKAPPSSVSRF